LVLALLSTLDQLLSAYVCGVYKNGVTNVVCICAIRSSF